MINFNCTSVDCHFAARTQGTNAEQLDYLIGPSCEWYPDKYPCPLCACNCTMDPVIFDHKRPVDLTVQEAFAAFAGAGLPSEQECSASAVRELLTNAKVTRVTTRHISGTSRCCLDSLTLEDGTILHIGASTHGATVFRIQRREFNAG